ncbi:MAG: DUF2797 domain-containing protein [Cyclobacteriaceae bacterium]
MNTQIGSPIQYTLALGEDQVVMNDLIGSHVHLQATGTQCLNCASTRKKLYRQGHCYDCFYEIPQTADWIMKPELSKAHLGIEERDLEFEKEVQLKPHVVYLALSSDVKVGVTRKTQVPTRWIDQGANAALPIVETPNRYLAGITEVALKNFVADKTNWRKMLKNDVAEEDLMDVRDSLLRHIPEEAKEFVVNDEELTLDYPIERYPIKVKSLNLTKTPDYSGKLVGIKGQYLIFDDDIVFNVRSNEGIVVNLEV